jgi:hypothetical protein
MCVFPWLDEHAGVGRVLRAKHVKPFLGTFGASTNQRVLVLVAGCPHVYLLTTKR